MNDLTTIEAFNINHKELAEKLGYAEHRSLKVLIKKLIFKGTIKEGDDYELAFENIGGAPRSLYIFSSMGAFKICNNSEAPNRVAVIERLMKTLLDVASRDAKPPTRKSGDFLAGQAQMQLEELPPLDQPAPFEPRMFIKQEVKLKAEIEALMPRLIQGFQASGLPESHFKCVLVHRWLRGQLVGYYGAACIAGLSGVVRSLYARERINGRYVYTTHAPYDG